MYYILDHSFDSIIKLSSLLMFCLSFVAETNANAILHFFFNFRHFIWSFDLTFVAETNTSA